jgi:hypothetical protein
MSPPSSQSSDSNTGSRSRPTVDLRNRNIAALLAWMVPGAGHFYQRRYAKGVLFTVCILSTWIVGLVVGSSRVVYASWQPNDRRWQFIFQAGVGLPAFPAVAQAYGSNGGKDPLFGLKYMVPPGKVDPENADLLADWHSELGHMYEMGSLYTMIAGLLNILAIYDAYAGPLFPDDESEKKRKKKKEQPPSDENSSG